MHNCDIISSVSEIREDRTKGQIPFDIEELRMGFIVNGDGIIVDRYVKDMYLTTITTCNHTLAHRLGISVKVRKSFERNISANLGRNEDLGERIHLGKRS